jgi:Flp pilus assembly protein TadG
MTPRPANSATARQLLRYRSDHRRGGAMVEAVLVLSILVMLSMGGAEFGFAFYLKHALQAAASVGVRTAILPTSSDAAVQSAVAAEMTSEGLQNISYTLTTNPSSVTACPTGTFVTVTVTCTWGNVGVSPLPVSMGGFASTKQFSCSGTMVHE